MNTHPTRIGAYEVVRLLGRGGMGAVYLARDPAIGRLVAIKLLREGVESDELRERFAREARAAGGLRHPNIVTIFQAGPHEVEPYLVMEYIPGDTLAQIIERRLSLTVPRKLRIIEEVCHGLAYAHRAGVVHRDVKPANILVDSDGIVKILDFGIARMGEAGLTRGGMVVGSLNYMAPEQIDPGTADLRSDVFAVGLVLYELLTYQKAFPGQDFSVFHRILHSEPAPLPTLCEGIAPDLVEIVARALLKNPDERYQDLAGMRAALSRVRMSLRRGREDLSDEGPLVASGNDVSNDVTVALAVVSPVDVHLNNARRCIAAAQPAEAVEHCDSALAIVQAHPEAVELRHAAVRAATLAQAKKLLGVAQEEWARGDESRVRELLREVGDIAADVDVPSGVLTQLAALQDEVTALATARAAAEAVVKRGQDALARQALDEARDAWHEAHALAPAAASVVQLGFEVSAAEQAALELEERARREAAAEAQRQLDVQAAAAAEVQARREAEEAAEQARLEAEARARRKAEEAEQRAQREAEAAAERVRLEAEEQARLESEAAAERARQEAAAEAQARLEAEARARREAAEAEEQARQEAAAEAQRQAEIQAAAAEDARLQAEAQAKAEAQARLEAEAAAERARRQAEEATERARREEQERARREAAAAERARQHAAAEAERQAAAQAAVDDQSRREAHASAVRAALDAASAQATSGDYTGALAALAILRFDDPTLTSADLSTLERTSRRLTKQWRGAERAAAKVAKRDATRRADRPSTVPAAPGDGTSSFAIRPVYWVAAAVVVLTLGLGAAWRGMSTDAPDVAPTDVDSTSDRVPSSPTDTPTPPPVVSAGPDQPDVPPEIAPLASTPPAARALHDRLAPAMRRADVDAALALIERADAAVVRDALIQNDLSRLQAMANRAAEDALAAARQADAPRLAAAEHQTGLTRRSAATALARQGDRPRAIRALLDATDAFNRAATSSRAAAHASLRQPADDPSPPRSTTVSKQASVAPETPSPEESRPSPAKNDTPAPPPVRVATQVDETPAIRAVLDQYVRGFSTLDVALVRRAWPSAPAGLNFDNVNTQTVTLQNMQISIAPGEDTATVTCIRSHTSQMKAGRPVNDRRTTTFSMSKRGGSWVISSVK